LAHPKKAKVGRPKLPKGKAKGRIVPVRFTAGDLKAVAARARASKQNVSEWIRSTIMGRNIKRWYGFCPDESHITLFENRPRERDECYGCGCVTQLHGIAEGYVSYDEAAKGLANSKPLSNPDSNPAPTRL
jgi:hypothetical protein